jgi:hypothetical protein
MSNNPPVGSVILEEVRLVAHNGESVNLVGQVMSLEVYENIYATSLISKITISDSLGLISKLPIVGMEPVSISYKTFTKSSTYNEIKLEFIVVGMPMLNGQSNAGLYTLDLISIDYVKNTSILISSKLKGFGSELVKSMLGKLDIKKTINIEDSINSLEFLPNFWTPFECILYCAENSQDTTTYKANSFLFYEDTKSYNFVSYDGLLRPQYSPHEVDMVYNYNNDMSRTPDANGGLVLDQAAEYTRVLNMRVNYMFDYLSEYKANALNVTSYEANVLRKHMIKRKYDYTTEYDKQARLGDMPSYMLSGRYPTITKSVTLGETWLNSTDDRGTVALTRRAMLGQLNMTSIEIEVHGRTDMYAGRLIELNFPTFATTSDGSSPTDVYHSGLYLVANIRHTISGGTHKMTLGLLKDGLK